MTSRFSGKSIEFIQKASRQKKVEWLERHSDDYEALIREPLNELARHLKAKLARVATGYHFPQRGLGRLKRSSAGAAKYGTPLKDYVSFSASRPPKSRFEKNPNLFFLIYPDDPDGDQVLVAGGLYLPSSRQVRAIREAIAADPKPLERLFRSPEFAARFPGGFSDERSSSRVPRGFDPDHPRVDWLKLQAFFVWRPYTLREFTSAKFPDLVTQDFTQILRLNELLDSVLQGRPQKVPPRTERDAPGLVSRLEEVETRRRVMDF